MRGRMSSVLTLELRPGEDFQVLRGQVYEEHNEHVCAQCLLHPQFNDNEWPKLHTVGRTLNGPPTELVLLEAPQVELLSQVFYPPKKKSRAMGDILGDIFGFIKSIIDAILSFIGRLLARIAHDLMHPMDLLKDLLQVSPGTTGTIAMPGLAS